MKRKSKIKRKTAGKTRPKRDPLNKLKAKDSKLVKSVAKKKGRKPGNVKVDLERKAMVAGRRTSRWGNVYYEYRKNRTDKNPKKGI